MIYLDNAATTKPFKSVVETINNANLEHWYNPSGVNSLSHEEMQHIYKVKELIAKDINASADEIYFTGSGCEANTMAIIGFLKNKYGYDFYTSRLEHTSIGNLCKSLNQDVIYVSNDNLGNIQCDLLKLAFSDIATYYGGANPFVSIAMANSEIGVIQNIKAISAIVHKYHGILHCDAVQLFPECKIDVKQLGIDMMSVSAQKFHGPKGIGFLYVKKNIKLSPIIYGSQENGLRGGTYNAPLIYGLETALKETRSHSRKEYVKCLRDDLLFHLLRIPDVKLNGPAITGNRLRNNISLTIKDVPADILTTMCDQLGIIIAKGSACQAYKNTPSQSLKAIGLSDDEALSTIRITVDQFNTISEIEKVSKIIPTLVERIRNGK